MIASSITTRASTKNGPYPNTKMWLRITGVIHTTVNPAPSLAVLGIRNRTATTVSNTPDPSRNTDWDTNPWTACDICVNRATESGTAANLRKMAAYRRFTDTNRRITSCVSCLPINPPFPTSLVPCGIVLSPSHSLQLITSSMHFGRLAKKAQQSCIDFLCVRPDDRVWTSFDHDQASCFDEFCCALSGRR